MAFKNVAFCCRKSAKYISNAAAAFSTAGHLTLLVGFMKAIPLFIYFGLKVEYVLLFLADDLLQYSFSL